MASVIHNTTYVIDGLNRLLTRFRDKPRIVALLTSFLAQVQELEDTALWPMYFNRLLQNGVASGDLLRLIGGLVGQGSEGLSDAEFFLLIQARIKANHSGGFRENLIDIASILSGGLPIYCKQFAPASIVIAPQGAFPIDPYLVADKFLIPAVAASEQLTFVWTPQPIANTWIGGSIYAPGFAAGPPVVNAGVTAGQSPGSIYAPGFAAGPPVVTAGGGVGAGVIQTTGET